MMIGLCDCNNFFVSCQRLFQPDLNGKPVAVLSGNDGCVIARSNEVKALGVKMGVPLYQIKSIVESNNVTLFSANHHLYADISQRVMAILRANTPAIEIYSIDEAFIDLSQFDVETLKPRGEALSKKVTQCTGIPVSIGIAPTKTLAKIACRLCKSYPKLNGCCLMYRDEDIAKVLKTIPVGDIWGIGRKSVNRLSDIGVHTAYQFTQLSEKQVDNMLHLSGVRIWRELRGIPAIEFDSSHKPHQSISIGRSFASDITSLDELHSIVAKFSSSIAKKLRLQGSCVTQITVTLETNRHRTDLPQRNVSDTVEFMTPTDSTLDIAKAASMAIRRLYKVGYGYKKAGISCSGLVQKEHLQTSLFEEEDREKQRSLMRTIDKINSSYGQGGIRLAVESSRDLNSNQRHLSPSYTTKWSDLPNVKIL